MCDPVTMQDYGGFLDGIGLLDAQKRDVFRKYAALTIKYINAKQFVKAFQVGGGGREGQTGETDSSVARFFFSS